MAKFFKWYVYFSQLLLFAHCCYASSDHEMSVGVQKEQICSQSTVAIVGKFLKKSSFQLPPDNHSPSEEATIAAAACKLNPANKQITIAAIAYESGKDYTKSLIIAFVDNAQGKVVSSYQGEIGEDGAMRLESGSLWIDTAPYRLAKGVSAFGLDVTSGYIPHCVEGGFGAQRSLYIQEGKGIRPVLEDIFMSTWGFIQEGQSRCTGPDAPEETLYENTAYTLSLANTSTNGFRDIIVTGTHSRDDKKKTPKPSHTKFIYDGKKYHERKL